MENIFEPNKYTGDGVIYRNVLDLYDNTAYTFTLYMIPDVTDDGRGYIQGSYKAAPEQTVILAQTGVTESMIKNVVIAGAPSRANEKSFTHKISFDIEQPGAADFLDQIQLAKKYLNIKPGPQANAPLFLELNFKGYTADPDDEDAGGEFETVAGPYMFALEIYTVELSITESGSTYSFTCASLADKVYSNEYFNIKKQISTEGTTIVEHVQHLETQLNDTIAQTYTDHEVPDRVTFNLDRLVAALGGDVSMNFTDGDAATNINRILTAERKNKTVEQYRQLLQDEPESLDGDFSVVANNNQLTFPEGLSLDKIIFIILSMNDTFLNSVVRQENLGDPGDRVDLSQAFVKWIKINAQVKFLDFDKKRNKYALDTVYSPELYDTAHPNLVISPLESRVDDVQSTNRFYQLVDRGAVRKSYSYLFTGLNDQIKALNVDYKLGHTLLLAPLGGLIGSVETSPVAPGKSSVSPNEDLTGAADRQVQKLNNISDIIDGLTRALTNPEEASSRLLTDLVQNFTELQKKEFLESTQIATDVAQAIQSFVVSEDSSAPRSNTDVDDGAQNDQDQSNFSRYQSSPSGYVFGVDLAINNSELVYASRLDQATAAAQDAFSGVELTERITNSGHQPSEIENVGTGGRKSVLFSYLYQNSIQYDILARLDLSLRGDPWFLGKPGKTDLSANSIPDDDSGASQEGADYRVYDNHFIFEMNAPRRYDTETDDEDDNTGLWGQNNTAYFISGVYTFLNYEARFVDGDFTIELTGAKVNAIPLSRVKPRTAIVTVSNPDNPQDETVVTQTPIE